MKITNEQLNQIRDHSFIEWFNPKKHKLEKYKLILLLGKCIINGINQDGKCLFIPFDYWDEELQEGDTQDGRTDGYYHDDYLTRALQSNKYQFPDNFNKLIDDTKKKEGYLELFKDLVFQGVGVLANITYNNVNRNQYLIYSDYIPYEPTEKQIETILKIQEEMEYNPKNITYFSQYYSLVPETIKDEIIETQSDLDDLMIKLKAGEIINLQIENYKERIQM